MADKRPTNLMPTVVCIVRLPIDAPKLPFETKAIDADLRDGGFRWFKVRAPLDLLYDTIIDIEGATFDMSAKHGGPVTLKGGEVVYTEKSQGVGLIRRSKDSEKIYTVHRQRMEGDDSWHVMFQKYERSASMGLPEDLE